jgi:hypothetical protein
MCAPAEEIHRLLDRFPVSPGRTEHDENDRFDAERLLMRLAAP